MSDDSHFTGSRLALVAPLDPIEACWATPAFRAIARAQADKSVTVLCPSPWEAFWKIHFDKVLAYPSSSVGKLAKLFAGEEFDSALLVEDSPAARALAKTGVAQRLGPALPALDKWTTQALSLARETGPLPHRVTRYLDLAEKLGCHPRATENFTPPERPASPAPARIGLLGQSDLGPAADWPEESFRQLPKLLQSGEAYEFIALSDPGEGDVAGWLEELSSLSVLVAPASTALHLAAHLGVPCVALMGPHDPRTHRPLGKKHEVLTTHAECAPCLLARCPLDHRCLTELPAEAVAEAITRLLPQEELLASK
ncbi:glycosyltransferase family 9 protein [Roseibacillus ishigakijimensis]|uniref:ADP-heptose:LPS heptosyltransferase n=1 Tax=Roseibacillus ishigakijimensis TaxID=454146 RepID=A0A934RT06_9BACT|nr:glycosyltransferase family 9 protein [Roseibacillus ishigakijimensis]MBK1834504.1 hypothetical protein [Roseibacillus ishigakijimensis]